MNFNPPEITLVLEDLRSIQNVATIYRTADGLGIRHIVHIGTTPLPHDKYGRPRNDFIKISLGSEKVIQATYFESTAAFLAARNALVPIITIEQSERSVDYKNVAPTVPCYVVVGNEPSGVSNELLNASDTILEIPQHGMKESLNVSIAAAIVLYRLFDK